MKCDYTMSSNRKPITVSAVIQGTWEGRFSDAISSTPEYIRATFVRHQKCGFKVERGTVEGMYGNEDFFSFEDLYAILEKYTSDTDFSSLLYA